MFLFDCWRVLSALSSNIAFLISHSFHSSSNCCYLVVNSCSSSFSKSSKSLLVSNFLSWEEFCYFRFLLWESFRLLPLSKLLWLPSLLLLCCFGICFGISIYFSSWSAVVCCFKGILLLGFLFSLWTFFEMESDYCWWHKLLFADSRWEYSWLSAISDILSRVRYLPPSSWRV